LVNSQSKLTHAARSTRRLPCTPCRKSVHGQAKHHLPMMPTINASVIDCRRVRSVHQVRCPMQRSLATRQPCEPACRGRERCGYVPTLCAGWARWAATHCSSSAGCRCTLALPQLPLRGHLQRKVAAAWLQQQLQLKYRSTGGLLNGERFGSPHARSADGRGPRDSHKEATVQMAATASGL
jgi:hypothetical protein